jgi:hypothetical protein
VIFVLRGQDSHLRSLRVLKALKAFPMIVPLQIESVLRRNLESYFSDHPYDGLLIASLDHSPSEQITDTEDTHTTVLILSNGFEHLEYAREIQQHIGHPEKLRKWKRMSSRARHAFAKAAFELLQKYPVLIFAITAHKSAILKSEGHFLKELNLETIALHEKEGTGDYLVFGPLQQIAKNQTVTEVNLRETTNRAVMVLFTAHFVRRMQLLLFTIANVGCMNFSFYADKPPGGKNYANLLNFFLRNGNAVGDIKLYSFVDSDAVESDLLADNFAGLLRDVTRHPERWANVQMIEAPGKGVFYWERWNTN